MIDCVTYILSAKILSRVSGTYSVAQISNDESSSNVTKDDEKKKFVLKMKAYLLIATNAMRSFGNMSKEFAVYLFSSGFALCAFMKASGTATWV